MVTLAVLTLATMISLAGYRWAGKAGGFAVTVLCGSAVAFFLMPPLFSFRVSNPHDIVALAFYGTAGLVLAKTAPSRGKTAALRARAGVTWGGSDARQTDLAGVIDDLRESEIGIWLREIELSIPSEGVTLPCSREEAWLILRDVLTAASLIPGTRGVAIHGGQLPGYQRLTVVAQLAGPVPEREVVVIGKRDQDCNRVGFPGWPADARASWFENGYACVFQISLARERRHLDGSRSCSVDT
jgi:hypothetical protein